MLKKKKIIEHVSFFQDIVTFALENPPDFFEVDPVSGVIYVVKDILNDFGSLYTVSMSFYHNLWTWKKLSVCMFFSIIFAHVYSKIHFLIQLPCFCFRLKNY